MSAAAGMRLRLDIHSSLMPADTAAQGLGRSWFRPDIASTIGDVAQQISDRYHLGWKFTDAPPPAFVLLLDGFALPLDSPADLLRDGDLVTVQPPATPISRHATPAPSGARLGLAAVGAAAASAHLAAVGGPSRKRKHSTLQGEAEAALGGEPDAGDGPANGLESAPALLLPSQRPSRSARRKSAKRRLRRMGVLPYKGKGQEGGGHAKQRQQAGTEPVVPAKKQKLTQEKERAGVLAAAATASPLDPNGTMVLRAGLAVAPEAAASKQQQQQLCPVANGHDRQRAATAKAALPVRGAAAAGASGRGIGAAPAAAAGSKPQSKVAVGASNEEEDSSSDDSSSSSSDDSSSDDSSDDSTSDDSSSSSSERSPGNSTSSSDGVEASGRATAARRGSHAEAGTSLPPTVGARMSALRHEPGQATRVQPPGRAPVPRVGLSQKLPPPPFNYSELPPASGNVAVGDVLAYRLLEIGLDMCPKVSAWRHGRVESWDAGSHTLTLAPHPDPSVHPLLDVLQAYRAMQEDDAGLGDAEPGGLPFDTPYGASGELTLAVDAFTELRVLQSAVQQHGPATVVRAKGLGPAGPSVLPSRTGAVNSQPSAPGCPLALPAASTSGAVVPAVGPWSEVASQLRRRREELAAGSAGLSQPIAGPPAPSPQQGQLQNTQPPLPTVHVPGFSSVQQDALAAPSRAQQQLPAAQARPHVLSPGAVKPRGGARRSALGPMLNHLRSTGALCDSGADGGQ